MIKITKYTEQQTKNSKTVGHIFEFNYMNKAGIVVPGRIEFADVDFAANRPNDTTTLIEYFETIAREQYDIKDAPTELDKATKDVAYTDADAIKTKLGTDLIE